MEREKEKTRHLVLGCRKLQLFSTQLWLLTPSPAVQSTTCCPTQPSLNIQVVGGSGWTSCRQRSSSGPEGGKKKVRSAAPVGLTQFYSRLWVGTLVQPLLVEWSNQQKTIFLGSPVLISYLFSFLWLMWYLTKTCHTWRTGCVSCCIYPEMSKHSHPSFQSTSNYCDSHVLCILQPEALCQPSLSKSTDAIFPTTFAHFLSLCHLWWFSQYFYFFIMIMFVMSICDQGSLMLLWQKKSNSFKTQMMVSAFFGKKVSGLFVCLFGRDVRHVGS